MNFLLPALSALGPMTTSATTTTMQSSANQILDIDILTQLLNPQFINQITNLLATLNIDGISNISPIIIVGIIAILYLILKSRKEQESLVTQTRQTPITSPLAKTYLKTQSSTITGGLTFRN